MIVEIKRPKRIEEEEISRLFSQTLKNNFKEEGILFSHKDDLKKEIKSQIETLREDFRTNGVKECFLIAKVDHKIVGTIAFGKPNQIIIDSLKLDTDKIPEIKSVYILPEFQNRGLGGMLLSRILKIMEERNVHEFCLDCGYRKAQGYWKKRLGEPILILKDYWAENSDHMIWHCTINEMGLK